MQHEDAHAAWLLELRQATSIARTVYASMAKSGVAKKPKQQRSCSQLRDRATSSRLKRCTGKTLPRHHRFMLQCDGQAAMPDIVVASQKLARMESIGLRGVSVRVLSLGIHPHDREVLLQGSPTETTLSHAPTHALYSQLCDWESVAAAAKQEVAKLFLELLERGAFTECSGESP